MATTTGTSSTKPGTAGVSTRERILDIALELFTEQGYDRTSLRDIAERLGTTKAALYYHFKSKSDILLELHLRFHEIVHRLLAEFEGAGDARERAAAWPEIIDRAIAEIAANRELMLMHQRNQSAFEALDHDERHEAANHDIEDQFQRLMADRDLPPRTRVLMASSIGAMFGPLLGAEMLADIPPDEVTEHLRTIVRGMFDASA